MTRYGNRGGDSGILGFEIRVDGILVEFSDKSKYLYTNASAGLSNIETMKKLAVKGEGLNGFINQNVKLKYQSKLN